MAALAPSGCRRPEARHCSAGAPAQGAAAGAPQHELAVLAAAGQLAQRRFPGQREDARLVPREGGLQLQPRRCRTQGAHGHARARAGGSLHRHVTTHRDTWVRAHGQARARRREQALVQARHPTSRQIVKTCRASRKPRHGHSWEGLPVRSPAVTPACHTYINQRKCKPAPGAGCCGCGGGGCSCAAPPNLAPTASAPPSSSQPMHSRMYFWSYTKCGSRSASSSRRRRARSASGQSALSCAKATAGASP